MRAIPASVHDPAIDGRGIHPPAVVDFRFRRISESSAGTCAEGRSRPVPPSIETGIRHPSESTGGVPGRQNRFRPWFRRRWRGFLPRAAVRPRYVHGNVESSRSPPSRGCSVSRFTRITPIPGGLARTGGSGGFRHSLKLETAHPPETDGARPGRPFQFPSKRGGPRERNQPGGGLNPTAPPQSGRVRRFDPNHRPPGVGGRPRPAPMADVLWPGPSRSVPPKRGTAHPTKSTGTPRPPCNSAAGLIECARTSSGRYGRSQWPDSRLR